MSDYFRELANRMVVDFSTTAREYLDTGLLLFHDRHDHTQSCPQVIITNLGIATEFMLKSFIAAKNPGLLFTNIPADLRVLITIPEQVPSFFQWKRFDFNMRSGKYTVIGFDECASCYYIFFPEFKQLLMPNLTSLSVLRDHSIHSALPSISSYDLERMVYSVLQVADSLHGFDGFDVPVYTLSNLDEEFFRSFNTKRIERVNLAIAQAKEGAHEASSDHSETVIAYNWETFVTSCPVCSSNGMLNGYTETAVGSDEDGEIPQLDFFATSFQCRECGLFLNDSEEMKLARMNTIYDRSDEIEEWFAEHETIGDWNI